MCGLQGCPGKGAQAGAPGSAQREGRWPPAGFGPIQTGVKGGQRGDHAARRGSAAYGAWGQGDGWVAGARRGPVPWVGVGFGTHIGTQTKCLWGEGTKCSRGGWLKAGCSCSWSSWILRPRVPRRSLCSPRSGGPPRPPLLPGKPHLPAPGRRARGRLPWPAGGKLLGAHWDLPGVPGGAGPQWLQAQKMLCRRFFPRPGCRKAAPR